MISRLKGKIVESDLKSITLDVGGVGYRVFTTGDIMTKISTEEKKSNEIILFTYLAIRENAMDLYGFLSKVELAYFELLITISGIGPKTALGIMNLASPHSIEQAVSSQDSTHLIKMCGVSKKIAEKIVLELKDKIEKIEFEGKGQIHQSNINGDSDALEALKSLGYSQNEAREALKKIDKNITDSGAKVKSALRILSSR